MWINMVISHSNSASHITEAWADQAWNVTLMKELFLAVDLKP